MALVRTLIDRDQDHFGPALPPGLRELYDGDLRFPKSPAERPFVIANFVSTLDGVVSYEIKGRAGGSTVSGSDSADGFIMGLLRACADAVIVGARTVHDVSPEGLWIPEYTYPDAKHLFREYRVNVLHKPEYPLLVHRQRQWQAGAGESNFPNARTARSGDHNLGRERCTHEGRRNEIALCSDSCSGCEMWNHRSDGDAAIASCAAGGRNTSSRRWANTVRTISGGGSCRRTLSDAVAANRRPQDGRNSTRACAGNGVYAGLCSLVSTAQRQAKG